MESAEHIDEMMADDTFNYTEFMDETSKQILVKALEKNQSNLKRTAEMLKLNYRSLRYLIGKYNIKT